MKNSQKKNTIFILFGLFLNIISTYSQNNSNTISIHNLFDKTVENENLPIFNGPRYINYYRSLDNTHCYYISGNFISGDLNYQNQSYYNVDLKYDINNDVLVLKPIGKFDYLGISLIKDNVGSFKIYDKQFININFNNPSCPAFMNGYYQEIIFSKDNILYIKHHKNRTKVIDNKSIAEGSNQSTTDSFIEKNEFVLKYKNAYYKIASKNDVIKIFPEYKSKIKDFYSNNDQLEESDNKVFIENLIKEINNFLVPESN
ncbi:hypothetical protein SAMN06265349_102488 [Flavobacterium resistens]|uniref:Uncharacterized protein n=1 Tax=Flavobacterium resistens TaxID=443612 RepID=A0A521CHL2_9FLAO|nr:hypothetical protein [Flavobacterium resistens]MRX66582.1 hypothetical protein [Flavobacterium resistens]SMO58231.1 hypothetical protein SAMN06265349_102488 [Flavobacterium resistens]